MEHFEFKLLILKTFDESVFLMLKEIDEVDSENNITGMHSRVSILSHSVAIVPEAFSWAFPDF